VSLALALLVSLGLAAGLGLAARLGLLEAAGLEPIIAPLSGATDQTPLA
jgi:hypothetical protein